MRAIKFTVTKNGKPRAYKWQGHFGCHACPDGPLGRWMPMGLDAAKLEVATGAAYTYEPTGG
jgi:hypothetical protein